MKLCLSGFVIPCGKIYARESASAINRVFLRGVGVGIFILGGDEENECAKAIE